MLMSPDTVQDTNDYFALVGLLAVSLALASLPAAAWSWPEAWRRAAVRDPVRVASLLAALVTAWALGPVIVPALLGRDSRQKRLDGFREVHRPG